MRTLISGQRAPETLDWRQSYSLAGCLDLSLALLQHVCRPQKRHFRVGSFAYSPRVSFPLVQGSPIGLERQSAPHFYKSMMEYRCVVWNGVLVVWRVVVWWLCLSMKIFCSVSKLPIAIAITEGASF